MTIKPLDFTELCAPRYNASYDDLLSISTTSLNSRYSDISLCSSSVSTDISSFYDLPSRCRYQTSPKVGRKRYDSCHDGYESSPERFDLREPPPRYGTPLSFQVPPSYRTPNHTSSCTDILMKCASDVQYDVPTPTRNRDSSKRAIRDLPYRRSVQDLPSSRQELSSTLDLSATSYRPKHRHFSASVSNQNILYQNTTSKQNIYENVASCQNIYQNISDNSHIYQNLKVSTKQNRDNTAVPNFRRKNSLPTHFGFNLRNIPSDDSVCRKKKMTVSNIDISKSRISHQTLSHLSHSELLKSLEVGLSNRNRVRDLDDMGSCCSDSGRDPEAVSLDSGIPLTSEDIECRTPEMVADMYQQTSSLRVIDEERRRLQLIEDAAPYIGTLTRRDKRKRPDIRQTEFRAQESVGAYSPASQTTSLRRANTVCSSDVNTYLRNKCNRESLLSQGSEMSLKRHSKSTFDSGFESGLGDILDEILGATVYDPVFEDNETPKTKWQNFKEKISAAFIASAKRNDTMDNLSDESGIKITKWDKLQKFVKVKLAKISQQDLDMGGFEDEHWRSLEPRQFHRGTRRTQSMVRWKGRGR